MNKNIWKEWKEHLRENIKQKLKKPQRQNKMQVIKRIDAVHSDV